MIMIDDDFIAAAIDANAQVTTLAHTHTDPKGQNVFIGIHIGKIEASYSSEVGFT